LLAVIVSACAVRSVIVGTASVARSQTVHVQANSVIRFWDTSASDENRVAGAGGNAAAAAASCYADIVTDGGQVGGTCADVVDAGRTAIALLRVVAEVSFRVEQR